jgi:hypothetical protein
MSAQHIVRGDAARLIHLCKTLGITFPCVVSDSPWGYDATYWRHSAQQFYGGLDIPTLTEHHRLTWEVAAPDAYLFVWTTFPKIGEWIMGSTAILNHVGWRGPVTGGAWAKMVDKGTGTHFRGMVEPLLVYCKGSPRPRGGAMDNLWLDPPYEGNLGGLWASRRGKHSEKPPQALECLIGMATDRGEAVLDLYAGEYATLARACRRLGRKYIGAEIDPVRHRGALTYLGQEDMPLYTEPEAHTQGGMFDAEK